MARIVSLDFLAIFKVFGLDAADADDHGAETILDSGQAPSPHAQGWNKPQGETPRSDNGRNNGRRFPTGTTLGRIPPGGLAPREKSSSRELILSPRLSPQTYIKT